MEGQNQENERYIPRLKEEYDEEIVGTLMEKFSYGNRLEVPCLEKIVVNMGVGREQPPQSRWIRPPPT